MSKIVIFGAGQTAEIAYNYISKDSPHEIVAFTANAEFIKDKTFLGLPLVPFETIEKTFGPEKFEMFVAMSYTNLNRLRADRYNDAKKKGYRLISYVSSKAGIIGDIEMGDNCFILENQSIQTFAKIGNDVWIWSGVLVGHGSIIGDHCWLTSEAGIGGNAVIGPYCFLGMNATVGHMVTIGRESFLGACTLVTKNAREKSVYISKDTEPYPLDIDRFLMITKMK
jgi:sugar O-acyltransferase (sialic acid O-acetyltransferase NeuD family)